MSIAATNPLIDCQPEHANNAVRCGPAPRSLVRTLQVWRARFRDRHAFPVVGERELRDLRLSRWDLERELAKPFWRG
jgi:uncharacterized protein YjiS (DUF1127 family)